jgi:hypothetical protein
MRSRHGSQRAEPSVHLQPPIRVEPRIRGESRRRSRHCRRGVFGPSSTAPLCRAYSEVNLGLINRVGTISPSIGPRDGNSPMREHDGTDA